MLYDLGLTILWIKSIMDQSSSDYSDTKHPSRYPWYLTRSCGDSWEDTRSACHILQAGFVTSLLLVIFYVGRLSVDAVSSCRPKAPDNAGYKSIPELGFGFHEESDREDEHSLEMRAYEEALSPVLAFFPESVR